jgi:hypothetical protein
LLLAPAVRRLPVADIHLLEKEAIAFTRRNLLKGLTKFLLEVASFFLAQGLFFLVVLHHLNMTISLMPQ